MRTIVICVLTAAALLTVWPVMLAAPQQTTVYPGQMTEARVWIQNRAPKEAIPVTIEDASRDLPPLRVRVVNASAPGVDEPVRSRRVSQPWQYRTVVLPPIFPVETGTLNELGALGWETTGVTFVAADGARTLLLKRPY